MSNDRSTLQRGAPGASGPQPFWPEPTSPAGRRLPSAPRERRPALAALAVLLIVACALGTGLLVISSGKRVAAIEISREVGAGQRIPVSAMTEVQIASGTGVGYVPWSEASQVSRFFAASAIPPGTLLTRAMVAQASTSTAGRALVGLTLRDDQVPRALVVGDHVNVYKVSDAEDACPGTPGTVLAVNAIVTGISPPSALTGSSGGEDVDLAVKPAAAGAVACSSSNGIAGISVLPASGAGASGATGPGPSAGAGPSVAPSPSGSSGLSGTSGPDGTSGQSAPANSAPVSSPAVRPGKPAPSKRTH
jgi:hypothetical protein